MHGWCSYDCICGSVEWGRQTVSTQGTLFALLLMIEMSVLRTSVVVLLLITQTTSIVFSTIVHNLSNETIYGLVDSNFKSALLGDSSRL